MGAVAWAIRQRPVSHPRSSNRTCRFPAFGFPTGFTDRHTEKWQQAASARRISLLRLSTQQSRTAPVFDGVLRLIANHHDLAHLRKHTRSQGPFLRRHYPASTVIRPCPTPASAAAYRDVEARSRRVSPDYSDHPSDVPCPLPRRIKRVPVSIASPLTRPSPNGRRGRHPHCPFRGLLRLHSRYGPPDRSAA